MFADMEAEISACKEVHYEIEIVSVLEGKIHIHEESVWRKRKLDSQS